MRNFREKRIGSTFIHAICSIVVLCYGDLVAISVRVALGSVHIKDNCCYSVVSGNYTQFVSFYFYATPVPCDESYMVYFDWTSSGGIPSAIISGVFAVLLLLRPLSLIYYPSIPALFHKLTGRSLPRFPKLDPVFDVFQGVYKDKMRWFAGVHLLYLVILWVVYVCKADVIPFIFVLILAVHSLFQPFKNPKHNYLETLYLVYLVLMYVGKSYLQSVSTALTGVLFLCDYFIISVFSYMFLLLPAFIVIVRFCYNFLSKRVCCQRFVATIKSCHKVEQVELEEEQQKVEPHYYEAEWL